MEILDFNSMVARNLKVCCHYALFRTCPYYLDLGIYNSFLPPHKRIEETYYAIAQYGHPDAPSYNIYVAKARN